MYYHIFACSTQRQLMRIPVYKKTLRNFLSPSLLFLIMISIVSPSVVSQDEPGLIIEISDSTNWNESIGAIVLEGRSYDITASSENESVVLGVNFTIFEIPYQTSLDEPFITVEIPSYEDTPSLIITATKDGYRPATMELAVLKGELTIQTESNVVEENTVFQVTVTDQNKNPVADALVYLTEDATPISTNVQGIATAKAPEIEIFTTLTLEVTKEGYLPGSASLRIENVEGSVFTLTESRFLQILPVLLAVLVVIVSILYVLLRKRNIPNKTQQNPPTESVEKPTHDHKRRQQSRTDTTQYPQTKKRPLTNTIPESRVEEIRIPVQAKKKETTILTEEKTLEQPTEDDGKHPDEWFKGQDYMRYKIDELTGKIDLNTDGKWFEGEQDTKDKVDEALKKNLKKKKIDENSTE
jgi:hypothetical protein